MPLYSRWSVALPAPEPAAAAHSKRLVAYIRDEMARHGGSIAFARYMELALHAPGLGYYSAGQRKFGAGGDFVTAPEISPLFSRCVARQVREALDRLGGGEVLEVGAGSGVMAAELMADLERSGESPKHYLILESSGDLRSRQQATLGSRLPALMDRFVWLDGLPASGFRGVVVANEVLDTLPVCRFRIQEDGIQEWYVGWKDGHFVWQSVPAAPALKETLHAIEKTLEHPFPPGYVSEVGLSVGPWIREISRRLDSGLLLLIDYGYPRREYYHPQRDQGTLVCYYRHRMHADPLILTGLQDISVHVDFSAVAEAASGSGLRIAGFTTQASFLLALGLLALSSEFAPGSPAHLAATRAIKQLTLPGEMGELVKVMALTRGLDAPLTGFSGLNLRNRL